MQVSEIIERILRCEAEGPLNDCTDNHGAPYQSQFLAQTLSAAKEWLESPLCMFCHHRVGDDAITDEHGEIACRSCGESEVEAQRAEAATNPNAPSPPRRYIEDMRQRLGLKPDDASRDGDIEEMTPEQRLELICGWHLGYPGWSRTFLNWARDAGFKIPERP